MVSHGHPECALRNRTGSDATPVANASARPNHPPRRVRGSLLGGDCDERSPVRDSRLTMDDLAIRGGRVVDGTGAPEREADVFVTGGRLVAIERGSVRAAHRVIDARGRVVAPGFIDIHTHSDFTLPVNPKAEGKIRQGVTTEVVGNCGFSAAPALPGTAEMLADYLAASGPWLPIHDTTFAEYLDCFPPVAVNTIMQVGHNTLRLMTVGMERRPATPAELAQMEHLLDEALAAGAIGLSSGLFTAPGCY